jgi:hypothetical protein
MAPGTAAEQVCNLRVRPCVEEGDNGVNWRPSDVDRRVDSGAPRVDGWGRTTGRLDLRLRQGQARP